MAIKINNAEFIAGATNLERLPLTKQPEICFAGRSNVGKSSLINSIVRRKNLALTSQNPGKTRQINLFLVDDSWILADLPGYGYAQVSKNQRQSWYDFMMSYITQRNNLRFVSVLVDARHDPMESDLAMIEWLENSQKDYIIILTKCDKLNPALVKERKNQLEILTSKCSHLIEVLPYSSISGLGRIELMAIISKRIKK
jgi:GTP-binding protein